MSKFYEPLKTIVEKDDWKIVEENEHTLACSCNGLNGWAISGMSVVEYSQRRLVFFRDNRLIGEIKLYDLDLAGRVVDEYMTGGFTPTMFISLDTTMEQWCQQIEDAYAGVLTGLEEEEDADAGSQ
ncbi:hypothetical protein MCC10126_1086 [Bifidobacterium longum subsp. longum]|uniref:Uncharacterized protein n=1 Tax=Bifidobacterium longum subsp. longum TaxID=1679 RepID=A0A4R0W315_BIFLL|nr:hypothetical protein [Bifidobacterium longum]TCF82519.1 hypothetical protein MCC10126_1086 [Bifidobacterium longum subsp. longum]